METSTKICKGSLCNGIEKQISLKTRTIVVIVPADPNSARCPVDDGEEGVPDTKHHRQVEMVDSDWSK